MQTKIIKDRPTLLGGGAKKKLAGGGQLPPCPTLATGLYDNHFINNLQEYTPKS